MSLSLVLTLVAGGLFLWLAVASLRRISERRRREFAETPDIAVVPELPEPEPVLKLEAPEPEPEPVVVASEPEPEPEPVKPPPPAEDIAFKEGMAKTSSSFLGRLGQIFARHPQVDPAVLEELEEALLLADVGIGLTTRFVEDLRQGLKARTLASPEAVRDDLKSRMLTALAPSNGHSGDPFVLNQRPRVILFVGVNGVGKTTTIGKIATQLTGRGLNVVLAAGDTFRAAAAEQLVIWGERSGSRVIRGEEGADPASVLFNAIESAKQTGADIVLADTAGRLHTKTELMDEIKKVKRAAGKAREGCPDETWLVVDATTGQNALQQAREFHQALGLTGVILTKLDGTAKGGVVVAIVDALKIPVRFVGVGEKATDLRPFSPDAFVSAMFGSSV